MDDLQPDTIEGLNEFLKQIGLNSNKIDCFWDRFDGMAFVDMANKDPSANASEDKFRKQFKRLINQIIPPPYTKTKLSNILFQED